LLSVVVISLVVWLVLVFLSITGGIEKNWVHRLTSLHAEVRLSPTDAYYQSYFYRIDELAAASHYTPKTIGEKAVARNADPYSPLIDAEIPTGWPKPDVASNGRLVDPVAGAFRALQAVEKQSHPDLAYQDYEISGALLRIALEKTGASISQMTYLLSIPDHNPRLHSLILEQTNATDGMRAGVLLPKNYRDANVKIGARGTLSYTSLGAFAGGQEQQIEIYVKGFYDPGVLAMGSKCVLVPKEITRAIHAFTQTFSPDGTPTNGIFVWSKNPLNAFAVKKEIEAHLEQEKIGRYWKVATYDQFEFAKDLFQQFQSDRTLLLLVGSILLIVACSNVISLLVLLVKDKKHEIAVLAAMGAPYQSIAFIFGLVGATIGLVSSAVGTSLALLTLRYIDTIVYYLSALQGRAALNPAFFGSTLPNELSHLAVAFVLIATPVLSLLAALIPATQALRIRPAAILRSL
jgi:lipoprotein-releasing system permease protein